jgi:hypothetical protein
LNKAEASGYTVSIVKKRDLGDRVSYTFVDGPRYFNVVYHFGAEAIVFSASNLLTSGSVPQAAIEPKERKPFSDYASARIKAGVRRYWRNKRREARRALKAK